MLADGQACATEILSKERDSAAAREHAAVEKYKEKCEQLVRITSNNALQYTKDLHALNSFARFQTGRSSVFLKS